MTVNVETRELSNRNKYRSILKKQENLATQINIGA